MTLWGRGSLLGFRKHTRLRVYRSMNMLPLVAKVRPQICAAIPLGMDSNRRAEQLKLPLFPGASWFYSGVRGRLGVIYSDIYVRDILGYTLFKGTTQQSPTVVLWSDHTKARSRSFRGPD